MAAKKKIVAKKASAAKSAEAKKRSAISKKGWVTRKKNATKDSRKIIATEAGLKKKPKTNPRKVAGSKQKKKITRRR